MWNSCGSSEKMTQPHQELALMTEQVLCQAFRLFSSAVRVVSLAMVRLTTKDKELILWADAK